MQAQVDLRPIRVGFLVYPVAIGQVFLQVLQFYSVSMISPVPLTHISSIYHERCIILVVDIVK
jgi:hypothetical protein